MDSCVARAEKEDLKDKVVGYKDLEKFVGSLKKPRRVMFLVTAGKAVDQTIDMFASLLEEGDILIDGGNEVKYVPQLSLHFLLSFHCYYL